jgi:prevent-host-death family protein
VHLGELVEEVAVREAVCITRRGEPVAQLTTARVQRRRIDSLGLRVMTDPMAVQPAAAGSRVRRTRGDDHY